MNQTSIYLSVFLSIATACGIFYKLGLLSASNIAFRDTINEQLKIINEKLSSLIATKENEREMHLEWHAWRAEISGTVEEHDRRIGNVERRSEEPGRRATDHH